MPSQRPVRRFAARWFLLNNSRFALTQRRSFPLAPRYDEPVQHCVVPPGELPGLQWEPPGSRARLARIRNRASHRCHVNRAVVYASIGIYVGIPCVIVGLSRGVIELLIMLPASSCAQLCAQSSVHPMALPRG